MPGFGCRVRGTRMDNKKGRSKEACLKKPDALWSGSYLGFLARFPEHGGPLLR